MGKGSLFGIKYLELIKYKKLKYKNLPTIILQYNQIQQEIEIMNTIINRLGDPNNIGRVGGEEENNVWKIFILFGAFTFIVGMILLDIRKKSMENKERMRDYFIDLEENIQKPVDILVKADKSTNTRSSSTLTKKAKRGRDNKYIFVNSDLVLTDYIVCHTKLEDGTLYKVKKIKIN